MTFTTLFFSEAYLATPLRRIPPHLKEKVLRIRTAILENEANIPSSDKPWHRKPIHYLASEISTQGVRKNPSRKILSERKKHLKDDD